MDSPTPPGDHFRNRALFQRSSDAIFVLNKNRRLRYANPAWEALTGKPVDEVYGMRCTRRRSDHALADLANAMNPPPEALAGSPARVRRPKPGARLGPPWWEISFLPIAAADGLLGIIGMIRVVGSVAAPKQRALPEAVQRLRNRCPDRFRFDLLETEVPACRRIAEQARLASRQFAPVALIGEAGVGKYTLARMIHHHGVAAERAFLAVDCAALPPASLENLLFGPCGLGRRDLPGTIFLREPANLPRELQARFLEWLDQRVDQEPRFVSAFPRDPTNEASAGRIIAKLGLALTIQSIHLLPLRDRLDDLPRLAAEMLRRGEASGIPKCDGLSPEAMEVMRAFDWPGNLRELRSTLAMAAPLAADGRIQADHLPNFVRRKVSRIHVVSATPAVESAKAMSLDALLEQVERRLIVRAMARARGRQETASEHLGIWRARLGRRLQALKIDEIEWRKLLPPESEDNEISPDRGV